MLGWRLILGTLLVAALVLLCWLDLHAALPGMWLFPVAMTATALGTQEILDLASRAQLRPLRWPVYFGNYLLVTSGWFMILKQHWQLGWPLSWEPTTDSLELMVLSAFAASVLLIVVGEMCRYETAGGNIANVATGVFALVYIGVMLSFAVQLRLLWGVGALAAWVITVKMGDIGAYVVGRLLGRHQMAPLLSPGKTIEGAVGGLAFSCLGAWLAFQYLVPPTTRPYLIAGPWWGWVAFGLLVGGAGMIGDLAESLVKRDVGVKDSSTWVPGFGGVLDIIDSLLLSAPVAWFLWSSGLVGR
jgi:phosphatidate cytidylyltransferase